MARNVKQKRKKLSYQALVHAITSHVLAMKRSSCVILTTKSDDERLNRIASSFELMTNLVPVRPVCKFCHLRLIRFSARIRRFMESWEKNIETQAFRKINGLGCQNHCIFELI